MIGNMSRNDTQQLLEDLTDEKADVLTMAMVYLSILFIVGIPGNILVVYYYWHKTPNRTTNYMFICALAGYDLISCSVSIPVEIFEVRYYYMFTNAIACKLLTCINYFATYGSVMTLVVVSVDRFRQICRPFKWQLSLLQAKVACICCAVAAFFIACPSYVFYNTVPIPVPNDFGIKLSGTNCMPTKDPQTTLYMSIYKGLHFFTMITSFPTLFVLYSIIGHKLLRHSKSRQPKSTGSGNGNGAGVSTISTKDKASDDEEKQTEAQLARAAAAYERTVRITRLMVAITVVFVVSFLPHISLIIWRSFIGEYEPSWLSDNARVAFHIGLRTYFLNCAINPFIYGFFNTEFRGFFYTLVCYCCQRARKQQGSNSK